MSSPKLRVVTSRSVTSDEPVRRRRPSVIQRRWLARGLDQAGGKLPLFDESGQTINQQTIQGCVREGWAEPWIKNPIKPDWLVCKLTDAGRAALGAASKDTAAP